MAMWVMAVVGDAPCLCVGAGQHPTAGLRIDIQHFSIESLHQRLDLGIVQLSHIELSAIGSRGPPEKNVRRRLHQTLPHHDALSVMTVCASADMGLEDRLNRLLELQKQRLVALRHHQGDPAPSADAADTNDLDGNINESIPVDKHAPVLGQRAPVDPMQAQRAERCTS